MKMKTVRLLNLILSVRYWFVQFAPEIYFQRFLAIYSYLGEMF
jgi:hypothetical protein